MKTPNDELSDIWEAYERDPERRGDWLRNKLAQMQTASVREQARVQRRANKFLIATVVVSAIAACAGLGTLWVEWRGPSLDLVPAAAVGPQGEDPPAHAGSVKFAKDAMGAPTSITPGCAAFFTVPDGFGILHLAISPSPNANETHPLVVTISSPTKSYLATLPVRDDVAFHLIFDEAGWSPGSWRVQSEVTSVAPDSTPWLAAVTSSHASQPIPVDPGC